MNRILLRWYNKQRKMEGGILALIIISPIACCIGLYQAFNSGKLPCVNTNNIDRIAVEQ